MMFAMLEYETFAIAKMHDVVRYQKGRPTRLHA
jgi:hypothetical protein